MLDQNIVVLSDEFKYPFLSNYLTILELQNNGLLSFTTMVRSNTNLGLRVMKNKIKNLFDDYNVTLEDSFSCWEHQESKLLDVVKKVFVEYKIKPIHACFETSYLVSGTIKAVAIGQEIHNPHSLNEEL